MKVRSAGLAVVLSLLILAGCSSGDDDKPAGPKIFDLSNGGAAVLNLDNVGSTYVRDNDDADKLLAQAPGCLEAVGDLTTGSSSSLIVTASFKASKGRPESLIDQTVWSDGSASKAKAAMKAFREAMSGCSKVNTLNGENGFGLDLTVDNSVPSGEADEVIRVRAAGLALVEGRPYPVRLYVSVIRFRNHLTLLRLGEATATAAAKEGAESRIKAFTAIAEQRLVAVATGADPDAEY